MTLRLVVDEAAAQESEAQAAYYLEKAGAHVAARFARELERIYRGLSEERFVGAAHPLVRWRRPLRRVFLDRFPFAVVFYVEESSVFVVAVEAMRRRPGYWRSRLR